MLSVNSINPLCAKRIRQQTSCYRKGDDMNDENVALDEWQTYAEAELFHLHFKGWRVAIVCAIAVIAVVGGLFWYLTQNKALWWWIGGLSGAYLIQAVFCLRYERRPPQSGSPEFSRWLWIWTLLTAVTGLMTGGLVFWVPAAQPGLLLAAIMISGTVAIGEALAGGHKKLVFAAIISQALMACIALWFHAGMPLAVVVCVLFAAVMIHFGCELNQAMLNGIVQRLHAQHIAVQLEQGQQRLLEAQHQHTLLYERQRVMQDMHDGLGSALTSALVLLETGGLTVPQAAVVMRECLDDLRLMVDSFEPTLTDLATLLGMLRYRLQHRFEASGIHLDWQMADLPTLNWLEPSLALDLLRLIQEAVSNALKHSAASLLTLSTQQHGDGDIEIIVQDNGCGFDVASSNGLGRGIRSMQARAQRLNARFSMQSTADAGTKISVRLPIERLID
jgi:signal transduction histidine kinase